MNYKQAAYSFGRIYNDNDSIIETGFLTSTTLPAVYLLSEGLMHSSQPEIVGSMILGYAAVRAGIRALTTIRARKILKKGLEGNMINIHGMEEIDNDKKKFPLEHSNEIIISDKDGLEMLMEKTAEGSCYEWATFTKSHDDGERAVMHEILNPDDAIEKGYVEPINQACVFTNIPEAEKEGYNGTQHYHPNWIPYIARASNYSVNAIDRIHPGNWMNLLTFNMPEGPEVIAFNRQHTYIPLNKEKNVLVRAGKEQIMAYLAR